MELAAFSIIIFLQVLAIKKVKFVSMKNYHEVKFGE